MITKDLDHLKIKNEDLEFNRPTGYDSDYDPIGDIELLARKFNELVDYLSEIKKI